MIAAPWYLLSIGIVILLVGLFIAALQKPTSSRPIDLRMDDEEIARRLQSEQQIAPPNIVIGFGGLCILVSILWRMARIIF